ncbi:PAS domain-containing sensor histidine kinase [Variovorax sp. Root434]|uniref:PAS domain-containing sensor histidine kinase n=1 Tax=Variovorax sp. Root434 TaxID=1736536 RepID=UPI0006F555E1|nr:PAS domain-containing sensor histidine kinase [Variovorax sp. Root434]KQX31947.1 histidine kinase [Variovorax sp. Root434]
MRTQPAFTTSSPLLAETAPIVEQMPVGIFRKDAAGRFVFVNPRFCQLKNTPADQVLGRTATEIASSVALEMNAMWRSDLAAQESLHHTLIMQTGQHVEREEAFSGTGGHPLFLQVVESAVMGPGETVVGSQGVLFDITQRMQADEDLVNERELLRALLDNSPDHIYFKDAQSRFIKSSTAQALEFGMATPDGLVGKSDFDVFSDEHARPAFEDEQEIIRTGLPMIGKVERETWIDGRPDSWALTTKMPLRNRAGQIIGTFGITKNISDLKEAERQVAEVNKQLIEASHLAGMARIAINVLHNVGNVLNSVNVSTAMILSGLRASKIHGLTRAVQLMEEHADDLGAFLASDARGKVLPTYLCQLAPVLVAEQHDAIKELTALSKNVEYIKEVIAAQQAHAGASRLQETVRIHELVEDALRINAQPLARRHMVVDKEIAAVPELLLDKGRVLQILVNLIANAEQAMEGVADREPRLALRVELAQGRRLRIRVADNGVGIAAQTLPQLFAHGFTTKKTGHGFGLHSAVIAAHEMGGTLTAHSDGPNTGATFTLELPIDEAGEIQ